MGNDTNQSLANQRKTHDGGVIVSPKVVAAAMVADLKGCTRVRVMLMMNGSE
jgi:hypothetical protein